jgi:hypothetical protein
VSDPNTQWAPRPDGATHTPDSIGEPELWKGLYLDHTLPWALALTQHTRAIEEIIQKGYRPGQPLGKTGIPHPHLSWSILAEANAPDLPGYRCVNGRATDPPPGTVPCKQLFQYLRKRNLEDPCMVSACPNQMKYGPRTGGQKREDLVVIRCAFADLDEGDWSLDRVLAESPLRPSMVVQSSKSSKLHLYWLLANHVPIQNPGADRLARAVQLGIIDSFPGADRTLKDLSKKLRVPGFFHQKDFDHPKLVQLVHCEPLLRYTLGQLHGAFPHDLVDYAQEREPAPSPLSLEEKLQRAAQWALGQEMPDRGTSDQALMHLATCTWRCDLEADEARDLLLGLIPRWSTCQIGKLPSILLHKCQDARRWGEENAGEMWGCLVRAKIERSDVKAEFEALDWAN